MNTMPLNKQFLLAFFVLALVHTAVSLGAYKWLTKTTTVSRSPEAAIDITTPEQKARGEKAIELVRESRLVERVIPSAIVYYVWFGYAGLVVSLLRWAVLSLRQT